MKRFPVALMAALLMALIIAHEIGQWGNDTSRERLGDWYLGFGDNFWRGYGWYDCVPAATTWRCQNVSTWTANRLPLYPLYLAVLMPLAGEHTPIAARAGQMLMLAATVWLAVRVAERTGGRLAGILTAALCLTMWSRYPIDATLLYTEPLYALLVAGTVYGIVLHPRHAAWWGVLWGAAALTRGNLLLATPVLAVMMAARMRTWRAGVAFGAGFALPVAMWTLRNVIALGAFVPFSTGAGHLLYGTYNDVERGIAWDGAPLAVIAPAVGWGELAHDAEGRRLALAWLAKHPDLTDLFLQKIVLSWYNPRFDGFPSYVKGAVVLSLGVFMSGVVWLVRRARVRFRREGGWLVGIGLLFATTLTANNILFYSIYRFRQPIEPVLFAALSVSLCTLIRRGDGGKANRRNAETATH